MGGFFCLRLAETGKSPPWVNGAGLASISGDMVAGVILAPVDTITDRFGATYAIRRMLLGEGATI